MTSGGRRGRERRTEDGKGEEQKDHDHGGASKLGPEIASLLS